MHFKSQDSRLLELPPEVLTNIMSHLPAIDRLGCFPAICKKTHRAAKQCPPAAVTLCLSYFGNPSVRMQLFESWVNSVEAQRITSLRLSYDRDPTCCTGWDIADPRSRPGPSAPYAALTGLRSLELNGLVLTPSEAGHLQGLTSLQTVSPCSRCAAAAIARLSSLRRLELSLRHGPNFRIISERAAWKALGSSLTSLSSLQLQYPLEDTLVPLLSGLSNLRHLAIQDDIMRADVLRVIGPNLHQLTSLGLTYEGAEISIPSNVAHFRGLQKISISCVTLNDPSHLSALTQLTSLHAYGWKFTATTAAAQFLDGVLPSFSRLQHLSMLYTTWPAATPALLFGRIAQRAHLRRLELVSYHDEHTSAAPRWPLPAGCATSGLFAVPGSMQALEELTIGSSMFQSSSGFQNLAATCPNLTKLHIEGVIRPESAANGATALASLRHLREVRLEILDKIEASRQALLRQQDDDRGVDPSGLVAQQQQQQHEDSLASALDAAE